MPFPTHMPNPLDASDRKKLIDALHLAEKAKANCDSMGVCGMDTTEHRERIDGIEELANAILREYFAGG